MKIKRSPRFVRGSVDVAALRPPSAFVCVLLASLRDSNKLSKHWYVTSCDWRQLR